MEDIKRWIWKLTLMLLLLLSLWRLWLQSYSRCNNDMHESKVSMLYFHYLNSFLVLKRKIWDVCIPRRKTNLSPLEHQNHKGLVPALPNLYRNGGHSEVSFHEVCYSGEDVIFPRQVTRWTHSLFQLLLTGFRDRHMSPSDDSSFLCFSWDFPVPSSKSSIDESLIKGWSRCYNDLNSTGEGKHCSELVGSCFPESNA